MIALQPYLKQVVEFAVAGYVFGGKVIVVVKYRFVFRVFMIQLRACSLPRRKSSFMKGMLFLEVWESAGV